jgi:hypothetical protein
MKIFSFLISFLRRGQWQQHCRQPRGLWGQVGGAWLIGLLLFGVGTIPVYSRSPDKRSDRGGMRGEPRLGEVRIFEPPMIDLSPRGDAEVLEPPARSIQEPEPEAAREEGEPNEEVGRDGGAGPSRVSARDSPPAEEVERRVTVPGYAMGTGEVRLRGVGGGSTMMAGSSRRAVDDRAEGADVAPKAGVGPGSEPRAAMSEEQLRQRALMILHERRLLMEQKARLDAADEARHRELQEKMDRLDAEARKLPGMLWGAGAAAPEGAE